MASEPSPRREYSPSALPSTGVRVAAFASILLAGICGGVIGYAFVKVQCEGDCTIPTGIGMLVGALGFALGVAVVATLALRATTEWRTIQHQQTSRTNGGA